MNSIKLATIFISLLIVATSCSTSSDVVSNNNLVKRKYRHGFHLNGWLHPSTSSSSLAQDALEPNIIKDQVTANIEPIDLPDVDGSEIEKWMPSKVIQHDDNTFHVKAASSIYEPSSALKVVLEKTAPLDHNPMERVNHTPISDESKSNADVIALSLAIISMILIAIPLVNLVLPALGIFFSSRALREDPGSKLAQVARIVSISTLVVSALYTLVYAAYFAFFILLFI